MSSLFLGLILVEGDGISTTVEQHNKLACISKVVYFSMYPNIHKHHSEKNELLISICYLQLKGTSWGPVRTVGWMYN